MPIYVFVCSVCEQTVEELRKMGDDTLPDPHECPKGGQCEFERRITAPGLKFIGEGWGGWQPTADGNFIQRTTPGKRKVARHGKSNKAKAAKEKRIRDIKKP